jgi:hypothetical protein
MLVVVVLCPGRLIIVSFWFRLTYEIILILAAFFNENIS